MLAIHCQPFEPEKTYRANVCIDGQEDRGDETEASNAGKEANRDGRHSTDEEGTSVVPARQTSLVRFEPNYTIVIVFCVPLGVDNISLLVLNLCRMLGQHDGCVLVLKVFLRA